MAEQIEMRPHVVQAYKDATDNLIYLKRDQFQVTYYVWVLLAAMYVLSRSAPQHKVILQAGVFLVGGLSVLLILDFHRSMWKFRRRLRHIYATYFTESERTDLVLDAEKSRWFVTTVLVLACFFASVFTFSLIR